MQMFFTRDDQSTKLVADLPSGRTLSDDLTMAYVQFAKGKVKRTLDLTDDLNLDLDAKVVHKLRHGLSA